VKFDPKVQYIHCPLCEKLMNRTNYTGHSGVIINLCRAHGIWLDRGDMPKIIEFILAGGLVRARRNELEQIARDRRTLEAERKFPSPGSWDTTTSGPF